LRRSCWPSHLAWAHAVAHGLTSEEVIRDVIEQAPIP
jgi:hypothetical protein